MLGSDPVYQYDIFLDKDEKTDVITLEPGSGIFGGTGGGEYPGWVDWYLKEIFEENRGISVAYTPDGTGKQFRVGCNKARHALSVEKDSRYA